MHFIQTLENFLTKIVHLPFLTKIVHLPYIQKNQNIGWCNDDRRNCIDAPLKKTVDWRTEAGTASTMQKRPLADTTTIKTINIHVDNTFLTHHSFRMSGRPWKQGYLIQVCPNLLRLSHYCLFFWSKVNSSYLEDDWNDVFEENDDASNEVLPVKVSIVLSPAGVQWHSGQLNQLPCSLWCHLHFILSGLILLLLYNICQRFQILMIEVDFDLFIILT